MGLGNCTGQIEKRGMARNRGPHVRVGSSRGDGIQESARVRICSCWDCRNISNHFLEIVRRLAHPMSWQAGC